MVEPITTSSITDAELRAAGFMPASRAFPRSEAGARWIAAFNNIPFEKLPAAWWYASNAWMLDYVERMATAAIVRLQTGGKSRG